MNRLAAARLLGVGLTKFDELRKTPGFPSPRMLPAKKQGRPSWDPDELKAWHRSLPAYSPGEKSFTEQQQAT